MRLRATPIETSDEASDNERVEQKDEEIEKLITLLKSCNFDKNDYRQFIDTFFVNIDESKQVKIDFGTKNMSLTELRTIVLNKLGLKNSSSFVLSFRGKTLPLGNTLISDPSIGLVSYGTLTLIR